MRPGMIEVTGVPLEALVRAAYRPIRPQGLGFMHFQEGDLDDETVAAIIKKDANSRGVAVGMDYVKGRSCKFYVYREGERLFIKSRWYDHSDGQLRDLVSGVGLSADLIDKARDEEEKARVASLEAAKAFLIEHGGSFEETAANRDSIPQLVADGLCEGAYSDEPILKREWTDHGARYSLRENAGA